MLLRSLVYKNYRGLKDEAAKLERVNHIVGKNGSGKTSIIEAAVMLLNGRSFQGVALKNLSNNKKKQFSLSGKVKHNEVKTDQVSLSFDNGKKAHKLNDKRLGQQQAHKTFPLCLIDTEVIQASSGQPSYRRDMLDRAVFHVEPQHVTNHKNIKKCLSQRNRAIVMGEDIRTIQSWDETLAELGEKISKARAVLIKEAQEDISTLSKELLGESLSIKYKKGWEEESYIESLKKNINKDVIIKRTSSGPQKEDYELTTQNNKTKGYFSHGQEKLASVSFMIGINLAVEKRKKCSSIIIIDEAESGLDLESTEKLTNVLNSLKNQLLITSLPHHNIVNTINGNILSAAQK
mgnify:CR=1 FL=1